MDDTFLGNGTLRHLKNKKASRASAVTGDSGARH
jgi:hypothetical protein